MSKHFFHAKVEGQKFEFQMGWDTPMQWYYLVITPVDEKNNPTDDPEYSNLMEETPETLGLDYYVGVVRKMGVTVPPDLVKNIEEDRANRRMNHVCVYESPV
jgi:hypothetical protein